MKVKIFHESMWNSGNLEDEINDWLKSNNIEIIDIKMSAVEDSSSKIIITFLYEDVVDACMELDEFGQILRTLKS